MSALADSGPAATAGRPAAALPVLPARMAGHPFGADESGRPISHVKGPVVVGTVGYTLDYIAQQMADALPAETPAVEREARMQHARRQALEELVERLNAAIPDPIYHVTPDYLMDDHHSYSMEFVVFVDAFCYELSGDPNYYFESGARCFPASLTYLVRPLSVSQGYSLAPRVTAFFQDTDVRVVRVSSDAALIQWYAGKDIARTPESLRGRVIFGTCQGLQGIFAQVPRIVAGLPPAEVREARCILHGDECCEWEFTWQEPRRKGLYRLWPRVSQEDVLHENAAEAQPQKPAPATPTPWASGDGPAGRGDLLAEALPPLPAYMVGHPFGADEAGRPITHTKGHVIRGAVEYMLECVVQRAAAALPMQAAPAEREAQLTRVRVMALEQLTARLNAAIPDPLYHVSAAYLLDETHSYSTEFDAFVCEICRQMSGDPKYHFHRAIKTIPASLAYLARPFSLAQIFRMLPRLVSKIAEADMRPVHTGSGSAVIQFYADREIAELPPKLREIYLYSACQHAQGALARIPCITFGLPPAEVRELHCALHGDPYCEWEFTWEAEQPRLGWGVYLGALASLLLLLTLARGLVPPTTLAGIGALLPVSVALMAWQLKRVRHDRDQQRRLLLAQREDAEKHYDELQQASADLQLSNAALQHKLAELTALHEIALVAGATLNLDQVLEDCLRAITQHLGYDRALVLLADEERRQLIDGRLVGDSPEAAQAARRMVIPQDDEASFLSQAVRRGQPVLLTDDPQLTDEVTRQYLQALKSRRCIAAPLLVHGTTLGLLAVDNAATDRPVTEAGFELLMTVGNQIAGAIERIRLYDTLEQRIARRTAELAQATHEAQHEKVYSQALIQNSPAAIVTTDLADNIVTWNPAAERLFGFTSAEAAGQNLEALLLSPAAAQPEAAEAAGEDGHAGPALAHTITQRSRKDGTPVEVEVWTTPVVISGEDDRRLVLYHDLTEIKRAEEALQESQRRLADIINFMPDAVLVIDHVGRVIAWNRAIEDMTGIQAAAMLGKGDYEYALPFYGERRPILIDLASMPQKTLEQNYAHIRREGQTLMGESYVPHLKGKEAYLMATASVLSNSKGQAIGAIELIRDFTERKQMEQALQQAKEAAEAATQAKSSFLATMSHEIRTPMNAIIGMSGLLMDTPLNADQREFAETIRNSGDALLTIINDILDFSKMEADRMELEEQPFELRECVESALDLMKIRASEKNLELACEIAADAPPAILGDVTRLRQILVNLLGNAIKFTEQGEVVVTVAPRGASPGAGAGKRELHFVVRDTGIGIPPDRLHRLFQAFSQVDASTTRKYGGTGLGLAVSKRLSELMGGSMWVESKGVPGKGSAFHFTIHAPEAPETQARSHLHTEAAELLGRSVLIIDDNATNRRILTLQAQGWGMQARATGSPLEALEWIRQGARYDLAVLDLHMPEMNGIQLAEQIQGLTGKAAAGRDAEPGGDPETGQAMILLSSLGGYGGDIPAGVFSACLTKPIRASALFNSFIGLFAGKPAPAQNAGPARPDKEMALRLPLRILLAEDYVVNQKLALRLLAQMGYRADTAANGLEAIQALERQAYDVVLMDVQMPEMDGLEATRRICARWERGARPRIVAMTANAMQGDREMCLAAGMDDYVSKPIRVEELVQALARCRPLAADAQLA